MDFTHRHGALLLCCYKPNSSEQKTLEGNFLPAFLSLYLLGLL
jgi:hypothetical protein